MTPSDATQQRDWACDMHRNAVLLASLSADRRQAALAEEVRLRDFCVGHAIPISHESVVMYLAALMREGTHHGPALRRRLSLLDVAAMINGGPPWTSEPDLRQFVRGMYRRASLREDARRAAPLYAELVYALVEAILQPSYRQARDSTLLLLAHHARLQSGQAWKLQWKDIRFHKDLVVLACTDRAGMKRIEVRLRATGGLTCPLSALTRLRRLQERAVGPVFGSYDRNNMSRTLCALGYPAEVTHPGHGPIPEATLFSALAKVMAPTPRKIRDKALVLLAYGAYLSTQETVRLRADEVRR